MKTSIFCFLFFIAAWRGAAQGTVNFSNGAAGVNAMAFLDGGVTIPEGPQWQAELLLVTSGGGTRRVGEPVPFQSAALAGYFFGGSMTVPGVEAGATATFRVRAFETTGTGQVTSNPVTVTLGGDKMPPPNLVGLDTWSVVAAIPELRITHSQQSILISWPKDFPNAALEFTDSLLNPNWRSASVAPQLDGGNYTVTATVPVSERYYRLRLN